MGLLDVDNVYTWATYLVEVTGGIEFDWDAENILP